MESGSSSESMGTYVTSRSPKSIRMEESVVDDADDAARMVATRPINKMARETATFALLVCMVHLFVS